MTTQKTRVTAAPGIKPNPALGYVLAFAAAAIWGSLGIFATFIYEYGVSPQVLASLRSSLAFLALLISLLLINPSELRIEAKDIPFFAVLGFVGIAISHLSYFEALARTSVTTAVIILYTAPAFVALGAAVFYREQLTKVRVTAIIMAFAGCFLVAGGYDRELVLLNPAGIILGLISAVTYASYTLLSKYALSKYSSWTTVLYAFGFSGFFLICFAGRNLAQIRDLPAAAWLLVLCLVLGPTLAAYTLYVLALRHIDAADAGIVCMAEPASAALLAFAILGETLTGWQLAGAVLVLAGIFLIRVRKPGSRHTG
jgi:DME family drug/metabolite transporter